MFNQWKALLRVGDYVDCHLNDSKRQMLNITVATCGENACRLEWSAGTIVYIHREQGKIVITVHLLHPICHQTKSYLVGYELPNQNSGLRPLYEQTFLKVAADDTIIPEPQFYFTSSKTTEPFPTSELSSSSASANAEQPELESVHNEANEYVSVFIISINFY